jgi:hypothetical protein
MMDFGMRNELKIRRPSFKSDSFTLMLCVAVCLSSCYIPAVWDYNDMINRLDSIKIGVTTKDEVIEKYGPPYSQDPSNRQMLYEGHMSQGIFVIVTSVGGPGAIGEIKPIRWIVDIRYDEDNVVTSISTSKDPWPWFRRRSHYTGSQKREFESAPGRVEWQGSKIAGTYCPNADLGHTDAQLYIADIYYQGAFGHKVYLVRAWVWYIEQGLGRQVRIALGHRRIAVAEHLLDDVKTDAGLGHVAGCRMSQIVKTETWQSRLGPQSLPGFVDGRVGPPCLAVYEQVLSRVQLIQDGELYAVGCV